MEPPKKKRCTPSSNRHCCVPGCTNDSRYDEERKLSFHAFPKDKNLRKQWLFKIRRDEGPNFKISPATPVCSEHFQPSDFKRSLTGLKTELIKGAVPSVFRFDDGKPPPRKRKSPKKRVHLQVEQHVMPAHVDEEEHGEAEAVLQAESVRPAHMDHDYAVPPASVQEQLEAANQRIAELEDTLGKERKSHFSLQRFAGDDCKIKKYTGFRTYRLFKAAFSVLQPFAQTMIRWSQVTRNDGVLENCRVNGFRSEALSLSDQFFLVLCRLKVGFDEETLSDLFRISQSTVSRILITWINFLYAVLGSITVWPSREAVQRKMPCVFKTSYPKTRVILDCTEIQVQTPSSKVLNGMAYSYCKGHTTYKSLVGISPDGTIVFVSSLYTGSISDKDITARSGLLDLLEEGDEVMVDKGFPIQDLLMKKKASLVIPPFLGQDEQFSSSEVILTQNIARLRVHVERAIRRVKEYKILQQTIPLTLAGSVSQLWTVCALLTNFRGKLY